jgi:hypothetical protein
MERRQIELALEEMLGRRAAPRPEPARRRGLTGARDRDAKARAHPARRAQRPGRRERASRKKGR